MSNPSDKRSSKTDEDDDKAKDVTNYVSDLLAQLESDFQKTGDSIMNRMRKMGSKMDRLEGSISDLMHDAGLDEEDASREDSSVAAPLSPTRQPTNSSPSRKSLGSVRL